MAVSSIVAHDIFNENIVRTQDIAISENVDFESMLLSKDVLKGLKNAGFLRPSPIQLKSIPLGRCGLDLIVQAKSGTGKTCVFTVIALEGLQVESSATQVLVLAPTREIAYQIWQVILSIGSGIENLTCATFIGGISVADDKENLKTCHIAVGTPGRVKFLIEQNYLKTKSIRLFVLDEADQLLDECFQADINWIYSVLPENKQILALSATYPEYLTKHLLYYMRNPTYIRLDVTQLALLGIKQYYLKIPFHPHVQKAAEYSHDAAIRILSSVSFNQCLIFSNLLSGAQSLAFKLEEQGWPTCCIAGTLEQKERNEAMASLKAFQCRVLVSTDLTSRGIDAENVNLVINLDLPRKPRVYLHRIGRAGRFGSQGAAISFVPGDMGLKMLKKIQAVCNTNLHPLPNPIPNDLVSQPCQKRCIKLDDIVHSKTLSTTDIDLKRNPLPKTSTCNTPFEEPTPVILDSLSLAASSEEPQKNRTAEIRNRIKDYSKIPEETSSSAPTIYSDTSNFSETISVPDSTKLENSAVSIKETETKISLDSETNDSPLFHRLNFPPRNDDLRLVNQISVSPWKPTEIPQFKPVPSPGSYADLCSEFERFTCEDEVEEREDFRSVLPVRSSSDSSLKIEVCKILDTYYKKVCNTLLNGTAEGKSGIAALQMVSFNNGKDDSNNLNSDLQIKPDDDSKSVERIKTDTIEPNTKESQLIGDISHMSLKTNRKSFENVDGSVKHEPDLKQSENNSLTGSEPDFSDHKKAKKYRYLFRCNDDEYFIPDYQHYWEENEKLQSENSERLAANETPLPRQDKKTEKTSADKDPLRSSTTPLKNRNENSSDKARVSPLTTKNRNHMKKHSKEDEILKDLSSSESEEFLDSSSASSVSDSDSSFSDSDSVSSTDSSSCSEEERMDYPYGYPFLCSQYAYPHPWSQAYPMAAPMNHNPYWTCPNYYYYGYPVPFTQPGSDPRMNPDPYFAMRSNHIYQNQQNYIKWMTKYYLAQKQLFSSARKG